VPEFFRIGTGRIMNAFAKMFAFQESGGNEAAYN